MRSTLSLSARGDLRRISSWIAADNPVAAKAWVLKVRARIRLAARSPGLGRKVPELDRGDLREAIVGNYRLVYLVRPKRLEVLRIFEGHRLLPDLDE